MRIVRAKMTEQKVTRTFPPGESKGLDPETFKQLLGEAIRSYVSNLKDRGVQTHRRTVYRVHKGGYRSFDIDFPYYLRQWQPEHAKGLLPRAEMRAFFDYLWDMGELQKTLTGPDPQRVNWELLVFYEVVHDTAARVMEDLAIDETTDTGHITLCRIPDSSLEAALGEVYSRTIEGKTSYIAKCPLGWIKSRAGASWALDSDISLTIPTEQERARYLSRHHNKMIWHDTMSGLIQNDVALLEISGSAEVAQLRKGRPPKTGTDLIEEHIADAIDVVKWALSVEKAHAPPLVEATITYQDVLGGPLAIVGFGAFRRQEAHQGIVYDLSKMDMEKVSSLVKKARRASQELTDLKESFWYWGRACLAALERDVLVESVIGLENLLVANRGESRYRFGLHGAALLCGPDSDKHSVAKELKRLYDKRSSAVHGSSQDRIRESREAMKYLSSAIFAVIECWERGIIVPGDRVALQIEQRILADCSLRRDQTQEGLALTIA